MVIEDDDQVVLVCPDSAASWDVPACGNGLLEAGEACDNGTRECTATCDRRAGVTCADDDSVCVCDPSRFDSVFAQEGQTFYFHWVGLDGPDAGSHHFDGATSAVPGQPFVEGGEFGFDCDTGSQSPRLVVPPGRPHALSALPFGAIDARVVAATELVTLDEFRFYLPSEWLDRTLLVRDQGERLYKVDVRFYSTPCIGAVATDDQLVIAYRAHALTCPDDLGTR